MKDILKGKADLVDKLMEERMPSETTEFGKITEAMNYSVLGGGKRLRAIMLLEAFRMFSADKDMEALIAEPYAAAIECIHGYSLVHDDLPSMDNDTYRRGKLTTHAKYGHAMGVLCGDALLNYASELIFIAQEKLLSMNGESISELGHRAALAGRIMFSCSGYSGMVGGQVIDVCEENNSDDKLAYLCNMYELKTSRLFEAAVCSGAALGGADAEEINALREYASALGQAFQIRDDILDITSSLEEIGKASGHDAECGKITVPSLIGLSEAEKLVVTLSNKCVSSLDLLDTNTSFFKDLAEFLISRTK